MSAPSRPRAVLGLLTATVLLPLAGLLLGLWQEARGRADLADLDAGRLRLERVVAALEARTPPRDGRFDTGAQFRWGSQTYAGPLALTKAREALDAVAMTDAVARIRRRLPPVVVVSGGLAAGLSLLVLLAGVALGRAGCRSREALARGFTLVRRLLPAALGAQVLLATAAFVAAVTFEAAALLRLDTVSTGEVKLLLLALVFVLGSLWVAGSTLWQLRRALTAFTPEPLPILGRTVGRDEAPGLWRLLDELSARLGALCPDHVVVGLTEGFHVTSGPKQLEPSGQALSGPTLYLPLPYLPVLRADELVAVLAHELAHFAGGDTAYSLRFLPIYAGVGRSLDAVARGGADGRGAGSPLLRPALRLGIFVMDRFHQAVRHWSRQREFAADAAGAGLASREASARALLRTAALEPRIAEVLTEAAEAPDRAPADLVAGVLHHAAQRGLDDPAGHLEAAQPHPTDTHPPTRQRLAALGCTPDRNLVAAAAEAPSPEAWAGLGAYLADPAALCRSVSADFLDTVRRNAAAHHAHLQAVAAEVGTEERVLSESFRRGGLFLIAFGAIIALTGLGLVVLAPGSLGAGPDQFVVAVAVAAGAGLAGYGLLLLRRGERPFLVLRSDAFALPGLDRTISWDAVADLDMTLVNRRVTTRLLLPEMPFPQRIAGGHRGVKLDAKRRIVTLTAVLPRGMTPQAFADLLARYRSAAAARRQLAQASEEPRGRTALAPAAPRAAAE